MPKSSACTNCEGPLQPGDEFCGGCGAEVSAEQQRLLTLRAARQNRRTQRVRKERQTSVKKAANAILILAVLVAISGTIFGFMAKNDADKAMRTLATYEDDVLFTVEGTTMTVAEWRDAVQREPTVLFVTNYLLAVLFAGLHF